MSEALKLPSRTTPKENPEEAFLASLEDARDIIASLESLCPSAQDLKDTVEAAMVVPGVLRMVMDRVKGHLQKR